MSLFLSKDELIELTGRARATVQVRVLRQMGVPFRERPDGFPLVLRQHLTGTEPEPRTATHPSTEPNFKALFSRRRKH